MKSPICEVCVKSGVLCSACNQKLADGKISENDLRLARLLYKLEEKQLTKNVSFSKTIDIGDMLLVLTEGNVANLIGRGGRIVRLLSKEFDKKVRIINSTDTKRALQDLVAPARVLGINILYTPNGEKTKVIIAKEDEDKLIAPLEVLQKAANALSNKEVVLVLE
ncbi:MAG: transcription elongation factor NusA [Candidatus Diapherotrites archaeon]|nr:transcription elongation factor NusA [Candidatus Diapherotrites archaeon]